MRGGRRSLTLHLFPHYSTRRCQRKFRAGNKLPWAKHQSYAFFPACTPIPLVTILPFRDDPACPGDEGQARHPCRVCLFLGTGATFANHANSHTQLATELPQQMGMAPARVPEGSRELRVKSREPEEGVRVKFRLSKLRTRCSID
jgi:hypothetical protein